MLKFTIIIFFLYLLLCPFYIFESGLPQPADILLAIASIIMLFNVNKIIFLITPVKNIFILVVLIIIVNTFNQLDLTFSNIIGITYLSSLYYIFNLFCFITIFFITSNKNNSKLFNDLTKVIFISLLIQCILSILGMGNNTSRTVIYFNNPNQLGYYSLCLFSLYTIIPSQLRKSKMMLLLTMIMSFYLIIVSQSRAALLGVGLLTIVILLKEGYKLKLSSIVFLVTFLIVTFIIIENSELYKEKYTAIKLRNENKFSSYDNEIKIRGYDRIFLYKEYLLIGAGEGGEKRFTKAFHQREIHSGFGTILFSYGILGIILFLNFVYKVIKSKLWINLTVIAPVLIYNFFHQGFREPLFWIILAFVYLTSRENVQN